MFSSTSFLSYGTRIGKLAIKKDLKAPSGAAFGVLSAKISSSSKMIRDYNEFHNCHDYQMFEMIKKVVDGHAAEGDRVAGLVTSSITQEILESMIAAKSADKELFLSRLPGYPHYQPFQSLYNNHNNNNPQRRSVTTQNLGASSSDPNGNEHPVATLALMSAAEAMFVEKADAAFNRVQAAFAAAEAHATVLERAIAEVKGNECCPGR
jgi:hypothetical protein